MLETLVAFGLMGGIGAGCGWYVTFAALRDGMGRCEAERDAAQRDADAANIALQMLMRAVRTMPPETHAEVVRRYRDIFEMDTGHDLQVADLP